MFCLGISSKIRHSRCGTNGHRASTGFCRWHLVPKAGETQKLGCPSESLLRTDVLESFEKHLLMGDFSIRDSHIWTGKD